MTRATITAHARRNRRALLLGAAWLAAGAIERIAAARRRPE